MHLDAQYRTPVLDYVRKTANRYNELKPLLRLLVGFHALPQGKMRAKQSSSYDLVLSFHSCSIA